MAEYTGEAGGEFTSVLSGAEAGLLGTINVRIEDLSVDAPDDPIVFGPVTAGIVEIGGGQYARTLTFPPQGTYAVWWNDGTEDAEVADIVISLAGIATFATVADLAQRLGRDASDFSAVETGQAEMLLELATELILAEIDRDPGWADGLAEVPRALRIVCLEIAVRGMANPTGARSVQKQLGSYQHSQSFSDARVGLVITDAEVLLARRAVNGTLSGSAKVESVVDDLPVRPWPYPCDDGEHIL